VTFILLLCASDNLHINGVIGSLHCQLSEGMYHVSTLLQQVHFWQSFWHIWKYNPAVIPAYITALDCDSWNLVDP